MTVLLVGAGPMAVAHAKVLRALGAPFVAVGRGLQSAARFAEATGAPATTGGIADYLAKTAMPRGTPAVVAVSIPELASTAEALIAAGLRRILLEKPAGLDLAEIERVADTARSAGADVFVAYNRRFYSSVAAARAIAAEDGGISSFHVDFTEMAERVATPDKHSSVLANWFMANSSHVLDLAFYLGGRPTEMAGMTSGSLTWHPAGAVFAGYGRTIQGAMFTWHADWTSAGRWALDLRTRTRRLLLQPLESLQVQEKGSFALTEVRQADSFDSDFKPGVYRQMRAFLQGERNGELPSIAQHLELVRDAFLPILRSPAKASAGCLPGAAA